MYSFMQPERNLHSIFRLFSLKLNLDTHSQNRIAIIWLTNCVRIEATALILNTFIKVTIRDDNMTNEKRRIEMR